MLRPARRAALIATGAAWCMSSVAGGAALQPRISQDKGRGGMITIQPADDAQHTATVIGPLHGLGDSNMGWVDMAKHWHTTTCGHVKFILPNAPTSPVTINGGMARLARALNTRTYPSPTLAHRPATEVPRSMLARAGDAELV